MGGSGRGGEGAASWRFRMGRLTWLQALDDKVLLRQSTQALLDNRELKQKLAILLKEEADRRQPFKGRRVAQKGDGSKLVEK